MAIGKQSKVRICAIERVFRRDRHYFPLSVLLTGWEFELGSEHILLGIFTSIRVEVTKG